MAVLQAVSVLRLSSSTTVDSESGHVCCVVSVTDSPVRPPLAPPPPPISRVPTVGRQHAPEASKCPRGVLRRFADMYSALCALL